MIEEVYSDQFPTAVPELRREPHRQELTFPPLSGGDNVSRTFRYQSEVEMRNGESPALVEANTSVRLGFALIEATKSK